MHDASIESFLTVEEVAAALGVSTKTVRRRIADGRLRKAPLGGRAVRIPASELDRLAFNEPVPQQNLEPSNNKYLEVCVQTYHSKL